MLKLSNVEVKYSDVILVLRGVSLELEPGGAIALLGANGAGKTTVLKAVSGLLHTELGEVTDGSIHFNNVRIDKKGTEDIVKMGIVQIMEGRRVFKHLTVEENIVIGAHLRSDTANIKRDLEMVYSYFP